MRATSSIAGGPIDGRHAVTVRPDWTRLAIVKWVEPYAAICGRCVTQRTWNLLTELLQPAPTTSATAPPMPASTSSKMSVLPGGVDRRQRLERQHHAGQLPAGRDLRERPDLFARIRRDVQLRADRCRGFPLAPPASGPAKRTSQRVCGIASSDRAVARARGRISRRRIVTARRQPSRQMRETPSLRALRVLVERAPVRDAAFVSSSISVSQALRFASDGRRAIGPCFLFETFEQREPIFDATAAVPATRRSRPRSDRRKNARSSSCVLMAVAAPTCGRNLPSIAASSASFFHVTPSRRERRMLSVVERFVRFGAQARELVGVRQHPAFSGQILVGVGAERRFLDLRQLERRQARAARPSRVHPSQAIAFGREPLQRPNASPQPARSAPPRRRKRPSSSRYATWDRAEPAGRAARADPRAARRSPSGRRSRRARRR